MINKFLFLLFLWAGIFLSQIYANGATTTEGAASSVETAWETDFEAAQAKAKASGKHMLLDFTGSDWCGWCIRLKKEVFSQPEFKEYASKALVLVQVDFPRGKPQSDALKKQNEALAKKFNVRGFPTIILLSSEGELLAETGYQRGGAVSYVTHLKALLQNK